MRKVLWCFVLLGFLVSGVVGYADRIEIPSTTTSAVIDGEYGEEGGVFAYGVQVYDDTYVNLTFTEDAVGYVSSNDDYAYAYGVYTERDENTITHAGNMEVIANGTYTYAIGILSEGETTNLTSLDNSGDVTVEATGYESAYAYGVYSYSDSSGGNIYSLENSGNITATAIQTGIGDGEAGALYYNYYDVVSFGVLAESRPEYTDDATSSGGGNIYCKGPGDRYHP